MNNSANTNANRERSRNTKINVNTNAYSYTNPNPNANITDNAKIETNNFTNAIEIPAQIQKQRQMQI